MTVMDYEGHIVGIVGGSGVKTDNRGLNRATMSYRQPGSTIKPLAAYALALQKNIIHYSQIVDDNPLDNYYPDKTPGPKNWYDKYRGNVTIAKALEVSMNTIPAKLVKQMGVQNSYYFVANTLGLDRLDATILDLITQQLFLFYGVVRFKSKKSQNPKADIRICGQGLN